MEKTGDVCDIQKEIEWKINDFLQISDESNAYCISPDFSFCGISWEIWIYLNGHTSQKSVGWLSLYVKANDITAPITMTHSFQLKNVNGRADACAKYTNTEVFNKINPAFGYSKFMLRSKLIERKAELLPSGILTIICTLKKNDTDGKAGSSTVDEFTQTEEETGVLKLQQHLKGILENGNVSDVVLKVEDQEFKSHRCVLAARSPVFLAMMTHDTKEKNTGVVDIQDIDPDTFSDFLRYLYTGSEQIITSENAVNLYTAADKYQVDDLKNSCLNYMLKNVSADNFCDILSLSLDHVERDLTEACTQFYIENTEAVISTPIWLTFLKKNPVASNELQLKHLKYIRKNKN